MPSLVAAACAFALTGAACGEGGSRTFEPQEFVDAANAEGAGLALGDSLRSSEPEVEEVYELEFEGGEHSGESESEEHADEGASLIVGADDEAAIAAYERCEATVTLLCFRAANVAIVFRGEASAPEAQRIQRALVSLSD